MSSRWLRLAGAGLVTFLALGSLPATAHQFPLSTVMNALVKIEPTQAHLVLRVPLSVLASDMSRVTVAFPVIGPEIDLAAAGPAIQEALGGLGQEIALWEDGVRLVPSHARGRLSLPSDRSFEQYDQAAAHVAQPMAPGERIYQNQGFFDAQFTYPIGSPTSRFAIQMTVAPGLPEEYLKLVVRYLPLDEGSRAFVISNRSGRVNLNPAWYQAARGFCRARYRAYPERRGSPPVSPLPHHPLPAAPRPHPGGHGIHGRPFHHAHRLGLRPRAGRRVVPRWSRPSSRRPSSTWRSKTLS